MKVSILKNIALSAFLAIGAIAISAAPASAHTQKSCKKVWSNGKKITVCKKVKHCHKKSAEVKPIPKPIPPNNGAPMPNPVLPKTTCHAEDLQYLIGRPRTDLMTMRFAMTVRIEEPGMMYTMDYSPNRLRIIINEKGIISKLMCG